MNWLTIIIICFIVAFWSRSSTIFNENFVVAAPMPDDYHIKANNGHSTQYASINPTQLWLDNVDDYAYYPPKVEILTTNIKDDSSVNLLALKEVVPIGHPYRQADAEENWRPYYWRNYPQKPIFLPAHTAWAGEPELPPDNILLKMEEDSSNTGISQQGDRLFWRFNQPKEKLCDEFATQSCQNEFDAVFCYRRAYGKCLSGAL